MKLNGYRFLTDENIPPEVYQWLKSEGVEVRSVFEVNLAGAADRIILNFATSQKMVVISQDNDFGTLIFHEKLPFYGVVHLRPGHMEVEKTVETISVLFSENPKIKHPFFIVAAYTDTNIRIRIRSF